jgi:hypothetical protein
MRCEGSEDASTPFTDTFVGPKLQPAPRPCNKKRFRAIPFGGPLRTYGRFLAQDLDVQFAPTQREMTFEQ